MIETLRLKNVVIFLHQYNATIYEGNSKSISLSMLAIFLIRAWYFVSNMLIENKIVSSLWPDYDIRGANWHSHGTNLETALQRLSFKDTLKDFDDFKNKEQNCMK